ncbi:uncharacterized protein E6C27_scaffold84G001310 [Cucumis melo var. makuwa]|uniref:Envelope-like protein n=1 Tax=Cucumis melo var. makuwa TaxID=1194695 RepID=A0A5A7TBP4_CUCMM|nr:uncharacterized protein E6C27_scaffold84G001310 [Cucumis melo var. makuwa]
MYVHDDNVAGIATENVESEPVVSESHMSKMDSDERDDVPLASSSSKDIFIPTPGQPSTPKEDIGQSNYSPPVRSPVQTTSPVDVQSSVPNPNLVGQSTDNAGKNIADNVSENLDEHASEHVEPTDNSAPDDVEPNVNALQTRI